MWKKEAKLDQKILGLFIFANLLGAGYFLFGAKNFIPSHKGLNVGFYLSVALTLSVCSWIYTSCKSGRWRFSVEWASYERKRKAAILLGGPVMLFGFLWINSSIIAPKIFTWLWGGQETRLESLTILHRPTKGRCDFVIKSKSIDSIASKFCTTKGIYERYIDNSVSGRIEGKVSKFGFLVDKVHLDS